MRITLRIDDDLMHVLKNQAHREGVPLTALVNRLIRRGIEAASGRRSTSRRRTYREQTFSMGEPRVSLDKALQLAASLEDEFVAEKLAHRK